MRDGVGADYVIPNSSKCRSCAHLLNAPDEAAESGRALSESLGSGFALALAGQETAEHGDAAYDVVYGRCLLWRGLLGQ